MPVPFIPDFISQPFCQNGARNTIPSDAVDSDGLASLNSGFPQITELPPANGGLPPVRKDFNGILYWLSAFCFYAQSGGLYTYSEEKNYPYPAVCMYNGVLYVCIKANGPDTSDGVKTPGTDENYWQRLVDFLGAMEKISSNIGGAAQPVYLKDGAITACSSTVGSSTQPVYLSGGTITASSSTVGGSAQPVYLSGGKITASSSTVGSSSQPVYLKSGTLTALSSTVGSSSQPVYLKSGTLTALSSTVGSSSQPVYLKSGVLTVADGLSNSNVFATAPTTQTLLYGNLTDKSVGTGSGDLTLKASWKNFDALLVYMSNDSRKKLAGCIMPVWLLTQLISDGKKYGISLMELCSMAVDNYWYINPNTVTDTYFETSAENSVIFAIIGLKW